MRSCVRHAAALALCVTGACVTARAGDADRHVKLDSRGCSGLSESALREHLELELATLGLSRVDVRLLLVCGPDAVVIELYRETGERYPVQVRVALNDTAKPALERLVALTATELVAQAERVAEDERSRTAEAPEPRVARGGETDRVPALPPQQPRIELSLAGSAALDGTPRATLWGVSLGASVRVTRAWSLLVDTRFERGHDRLPLADVGWTSLSAFFGAGPSTRLGPLRLSAGFGARVGWLSLTASARPPNEGRGFTAPWAGIAVPLRIAWNVGELLAPFVGGEAGYVLWPVRGRVDDGSVLAEQRGLWLAGTLGVAVVL